MKQNIYVGHTPKPSLSVLLARRMRFHFHHQHRAVVCMNVQRILKRNEYASRLRVSFFRCQKSTFFRFFYGFRNNFIRFQYTKICRLETKKRTYSKKQINHEKSRFSTTWTTLCYIRMSKLYLNILFLSPANFSAFFLVSFTFVSNFVCALSHGECIRQHTYANYNELHKIAWKTNDKVCPLSIISSNSIEIGTNFRK